MSPAVSNLISNPNRNPNQVTLFKEEIVQALDEGSILAFHVKNYPEGHNWTLYDKWRVATEIYPIKIGGG